MQIIENTAAMQKHALAWRSKGETIILVPTMGYYHKGHLALMQQARELGQRLVVSLFVNPSQFGPNEDLASYPRNFDTDAALAEKMGADVLFAPQPDAMYPAGYDTWIRVPELAKCLCGASRTGHFQGVCTVVMQLFALTQAQVAVFGEKDWQQLTIIRRMVSDLHLPIHIIGSPIVREQDGLALSSRNVYLTQEERHKAAHLYKGLCVAQKMLHNGERQSAVLLQAVRHYWAEYLPEAAVEYLHIMHPDTLRDVPTIRDDARILTACKLGKARLIDNILLA